MDLERSGVLGVNATAPEIAPEDEAAGLVEVEASGGGSAWRRRLAPRHRGAVKSFFAASDESTRTPTPTPHTDTEDGR